MKKETLEIGPEQPKGERPFCPKCGGTNLKKDKREFMFDGLESLTCGDCGEKIPLNDEEDEGG